MSASTKVSALDHAMHTAHTWVNDVAREFDTEDREFAYRVLRAWLHTLRDRLTVQASAHFAAQLPDLIRGIFYAGWNPDAVPQKSDANAYAVRFAREANIALSDVGRRLRRPPPPRCGISRKPRWIRPSISFPRMSAPFYTPSRSLGSDPNGDARQPALVLRTSPRRPPTGRPSSQPRQRGALAAMDFRPLRR